MYIKMNKKAQITLFVILGIIIIAIIAFALYFKGYISKSAAEKEAAIMTSLPLDVADIREGISECAQSVFEDSLLVIGDFGGYNSAVDDSLEIGPSAITYGYFEGKKMLPSLEAIKGEIQEYMEFALPDCIDFTQYEKFEITELEPKAKVEISRDEVEASIEYAVTAKREDAEFRLDEPYILEVQVRLLEIHEAAGKIISRIDEKPETVDVDYLLDLGVDVDVMPVDGKTAIYLIKDKESKLLEEESFVFAFASKAA